MSDNESANDNQWRQDIWLLVPHPGRAAALLQPNGAGWTMPGLSPADLTYNDNGALEALLAQELGLRATVLRSALGFIDHAARRWQAIFVLDNEDPAWQPASGRWVGRDELRALPLPADQRVVLEDWFAEQAGGQAPVLRPPWARPGWRAGARQWIADRLAERGRAVTGPIASVKQWGISSVLRVPADGGAVYFKATLCPIFEREPAVTAALARRFPEIVPAPLAIDDRRGWMLLADFEARLLDEASAADRQRALPLLASLQVTAAGHLGELWAAGCDDRRLATIPAELEAMLADEPFLAGLPLEDVALLRREAPRLVAMAARLADFGLPDTLVHGDFHGQNIAVRQGQIIFFDWTDAAVGHPFMDLLWMVSAGERAGGEPGEALLAYLEQWARPQRSLQTSEVYGPWTIADLRTAVALALPLAALHQVISYRYILNHLEPASRWELASAPGHCLKVMFRAMPWLRYDEGRQAIEQESET